MEFGYDPAKSLLTNDFAESNQKQRHL